MHTNRRREAGGGGKYMCGAHALTHTHTYTHIHGGSCEGSKGTCCLWQWVFFFPFLGWSLATMQLPPVSLSVYFSEETLTSPLYAANMSAQELCQHSDITLKKEKKTKQNMLYGKKCFLSGF